MSLCSATRGAITQNSGWCVHLRERARGPYVGDTDTIKLSSGQYLDGFRQPGLSSLLAFPVFHRARETTSRKGPRKWEWGGGRVEWELIFAGVARNSNRPYRFKMEITKRESTRNSDSNRTKNP